MVFPSSHVQQDTILALQKELLDIFTAPGVQKKLREIRDSGAAGWKNGLRDGESRGGEAVFFCADECRFLLEIWSKSNGMRSKGWLEEHVGFIEIWFLDVFGCFWAQELEGFELKMSGRALTFDPCYSGMAPGTGEVPNSCSPVGHQRTTEAAGEVWPGCLPLRSQGCHVHLEKL